MRTLSCFFSGLLVLILTGCAGYHLGPVNQATAGGRSIEVFPFNNQTQQPRLGDALTQSLRERVQTDGTFHLATHEPGDLVVTGVVRSYQREGLSYLSTDTATPEDYRVGIVVHVVVRERVAGKLVLEKDVKAHTLVHVGGDLASAERQSLSLLGADLAQNLMELLAEDTW
jgi:hypothetical protein